MTFIIIKILDLLMSMIESVKMPMMNQFVDFSDGGFINLFFDYLIKVQYFIPVYQLLIMMSVILAFNLITSVINLALKGWQQMPFV